MVSLDKRKNVGYAIFYYPNYHKMRVLYATALLFVSAILFIKCNTKKVVPTPLIDKVWYTYSYYQKKAAREARSSSDTDVAFNQKWDEYSSLISKKFNITSHECDILITTKINLMAEKRDWTDNNYTEDDYKFLMNYKE